MAGIYIHIPFCKSRCIYCDYFTSINEVKMDVFVRALGKEIVDRKNELATEQVKTIYFGGGTPSRLNKRHFEHIFDSIYFHYAVSANAEITIETNPDDMSKEYVDMLRTLPFNRISIGIQSFDDTELKFLSRRHDSKTAIQAVKYCQEKGFDNINIDLMYGLPKQTLEIWRKNLEQACELEIQHISAYHLIYEDKTRLYTLLLAGKVSPVDEESSIEMFELLINKLSKDGFEHYEVSNFAKDGLYSQHNSSYWKGEKYIGLGAAAHSFDGEHRWWNVSSLSKYIEGINSGNPVIEKEDIDASKQYNEFLITGLRTMWGINLEELKNRFGDEKLDYFFKNAQKYFDLNYLIRKDNTITLSHKGIFISDGIISDLMIV
ncbi:MAG: radical SAM family heme chaperone HemW [Dysgonamonadaceae bacterium]|nr:radical SAM family heme chaperone HemW [Dysgonamonadaceae bacterium]MDD4246059.1 radical SAM family heme chaperone HemW [Dysgonamonadaceae bacterium]